MKKLIKGIVEFRKNVQKSYRESFAWLAAGQSPDALFIACSDSRVVPNTFASTNPGDLFVLRNVGNLIPPCTDHASDNGTSEGVAIDFSNSILEVADIIVCGHSECAAMQAVAGVKDVSHFKNLHNWLRHGRSITDEIKNQLPPNPKLSKHNQVSQWNVLLQLEHLKTYPSVKKRMQEGKLALHGWWFDIASADVYVYNPNIKRFVVIDEEEAKRLLGTDQVIVTNKA